MKLSKRLDCIAREIEKIACKEDILADIGTDHGYLPCFLAENKVISYAYACDVAIGPLESSKETIKENHLENIVEPRLGNGLEPVLDTDVTIISISGMGGFLMEEIFNQHLQQFPKVKYIVAQANICIDVLRNCLNSHGFKIKSEVVVEDAHHIYEVLVFERGNQQLTHLESKFGPCLLKERPALFIEKWKRELNVQKRIIPSLQKGMPRFDEVMHEIELIEGVINEN